MPTPEELQEFVDTLAYLEGLLIAHKWVYINSDGTLEELNLEKIEV